MQVIVNISDDGKVSTEVKQGPATKKGVTTAEPAPVDDESLDAGASPFSVAKDTEATQELPAQALVELDGGAGPTMATSK